MLSTSPRRVLVAALIGSAAIAASAAPNDQFVPILDYRIGPYTASGSGIAAGYIDYMKLLDERDGGVNGVKLTWRECETEYNNTRGVECYERLKREGPTGATDVNPLSTGIVYSLLERAAADKVPIVSIGYGRTDASDGRVFPYAFPLITNYWSQDTAIVRFIGARDGGMDKLKGKKIVNLYHDSAYGKETMPILEALAARYGFQLKHIAVPHPGNDQQSQWLEIREWRPDWVILRGWGVMNPTALKTAAKVGFPRDHIVGNWWTGSEEDVIPAGSAAKGFLAAGFHPGGAGFPVLQDIKKYVLDRGESNLEDRSRFGSIYYNRGVIHGIINVEAIRVAQERFGHQPLTGEQVRWGLEHLKFDEPRLKALGAAGLLPPFSVSCADHEGGGAVEFQQWDGARWKLVSDWIATDQSLVRPMIERSAAHYASEHGIAPRDCGKDG